MEQANTAGQSGNRIRVILIALIILLLFLLCAFIIWMFFPRPGNGPIANPGGPYTSAEGQLLTLDGSGSTGENLVSYTWDFGDGSSGSGIMPTHTYADGPNNYAVTLTVSDAEGRTASAATEVNVNNLPPVANANTSGVPYSCRMNEVIQLMGECDDPGPVDRESLSCAWADFSGAAISEPNYTCPSTPGMVTVTLTATDKDGASAQNSATIAVSLISADPNGPYTGTVGIPVSLDGSASEPADAIVSYTWDFGDGQSETSPNAIMPHTYTMAGTFTVRLTVADATGQTANAATTATISSQPEGLIADPNGPYSADVGEEIRFDGSGSQPADAIVSYTWDFGDGTLPAGSGSPIHIYAATGIYTVTLSVTDNAGRQASASTTAEIAVSDRPRAVIGPPVYCGKHEHKRCVRFDGRLSTGARGSEIVNYDWDLGDGNFANGDLVDHKYTQPGLYIVTLTITDSSNSTDSSSVAIKTR